MAREDGSCPPRLVDLIGELAAGEVGLIVSSHAFVSPEGQAGPRQLAVHDDRFIAGLAQMAKSAHDGGSTIVLQLAHAGIQAATPLTKQEAIGPSPLPREDGTPSREMTLAEIQRTLDAFVVAAERAKAAGFDGVQIHAAHGYLLSQFLSPYFNRRQDDFGGSVENRARIVLHILERIKSTLGNDFPVLIKMNSEDFIDGGLSVEEMLQVARMLEDAGIDGIELSGGTTDAASQFKPVRRGKLPSEEHEVFYREAAKRYKGSINVPLILVGGIRSYIVAEKLVQEGVTDFVSICRPFIREPRLVARWKSGDSAKSECGSCNRCFRPLFEGKGMFCVDQKRQQEKINGQ
jgi:2,4-dienoyl-CoA reductase-like NADH-dependent reductase (Old Yellow Enzyme family)